MLRKNENDHGDVDVMVNVQGQLQKLKEKSRKEGISYQFMLQLVCRRNS